MTQSDSIFGAELDRLKRLLTLGEDNSGADAERPERATVSADALTEKAGLQIGRYKLLRVLGEGGMGIVYLAQQEEPVRRHVALKVVKPGMDSKRVIARFEAEQQALALMEHPHIARVHDAGLTPSGRPYFVLEYVKGVPITEYCDKQKLTIEARLRVFLHVCEAIQHAHQKGIIHRDLKPSNILVTTEDDEAAPKVIDFGVAKAIAEPLTERTVATEDGRLLGTPEYMSPEQADMATKDIDTRTDIYALGVVLYELLAGVLPFDPQTFREGGIDRIRQVICEEDPKTPSTRLAETSVEDLTESARRRRTNAKALQRRLHGDLDWITLKAMEKDRTRRYGSAGELAADVRRQLNHEPVLAARPGAAYRLKKFVRRNRALVTGIAAILVVAGAGLLVSTTLVIREASTRAEAQGVSRVLQDVLTALDPLLVEGQEMTGRSVLDAASKQLEGRFGDKPLVEASIRQRLGGAYTSLGVYELAESHLKRALEIHRVELGANHEATLTCMRDLGWVYFCRSRYGQAEALLTEAMEGLELVLDEQHESRLLCMALLGWVLLCIEHQF